MSPLFCLANPSLFGFNSPNSMRLTVCLDTLSCAAMSCCVIEDSFNSFRIANIVVSGVLCGVTFLLFFDVIAFLGLWPPFDRISRYDVSTGIDYLRVGVVDCLAVELRESVLRYFHDALFTLRNAKCPVHDDLVIVDVLDNAVFDCSRCQANRIRLIDLKRLCVVERRIAVLVDFNFHLIFLLVKSNLLVMNHANWLGPLTSQYQAASAPNRGAISNRSICHAVDRSYIANI